MPVQMSLFPDAFGVHVAALSAMRELEVPRALELVRRARRLDPNLPNLDLLEEILPWLGERLGQEPPDAGRLAATLCALAEDRLRGRLSAEGAAFGDEVLARYAGRRDLGGVWFLDEEERVPLAMLDLVLDKPAAARAALRECLDRDRGHRADLWGYLGDACFLVQRRGEASGCYVRGLLLSAADVDLARLRCPELAAVHAELERAHPPAAARELLLTHAWIEGVLAIPPGNGWLEGHESRIRARSSTRADAPPEERYRRFALLLYLDRSAPAGAVDLELREEMAAIDGELFGRYMAECRRREDGGQPRAIRG